MLAAYGKEKQMIIDKYVRLKPWYEGDLQRSMRAHTSHDYLGETINRPDEDPITDRANWSGTLFWEACLNAELKKLNLAYEQYLPKSDDKVKYTWVGINPDVNDYPTMLSLYNKLNALKNWKFEAVVEGHTPNGYRPHIHMILYTKIRPNRIVDTFSKHFKCAKNFIEVKNMKQFYSEKQDYIRGKKAKEKISFVELDKQERDENKIPHLVEK